MFRITAFSDYREYSPAARRRILARIREDSYDAVRFRIDRAMTEVALRRYDDSLMDSFFDDAAAVGIKVVPSVSFHTPPWAREAELSFDEPETWRSVQLFLAHVVSRLWRRKELAFFRILFKPEKNPGSDSAFRSYLTGKYRSMEDLNRALGTCYRVPEDISVKDAALSGVRMKTELRLFQHWNHERKLADLGNTIGSVSLQALEHTVFVSRKPEMPDTLSALTLLHEAAESGRAYQLHLNPVSGAADAELALCAYAGRASAIEYRDRYKIPAPVVQLSPAPARRIAAVDKELLLFLEKYRTLRDGLAVPAETGLYRSLHTQSLYKALELPRDLHKRSFRSWGRALTASSIPYRIVCDGAEIPPGLKLMVLPAVAALDEQDAERLLDFVLNGGTLFCEGECGHYNGLGAYLDPERRFIAEATGVTEHPERVRQVNKRVKYGFGRETLFLNAGEVLTPYVPVKKFTETVASLSGGLDLICQVKYGRGRIILCAPYFSALYQEKRNAELEDFVQHLCFSAGAGAPVRILKTPGNAVPFLKLLKGGGHRMLFAFLPSMASRCELEFPPGFWEKRTLTDLYGGGRLRITQNGGAQRVKLKPPHKRVIVLYE